MKINEIVAPAAGLALILSLPIVASAQTAERFNLSCAPVSHVIAGTNTFDEPLTVEQYEGVIDETKLFAVDLKAGTSCHPDYCTPDSFGGPEAISSVTPKQIVFDDIAAREVESNDYNVMAYKAVYDRAAKSLVITYGFFAEDLTTPKGSLTLNKACTVSDYHIAGG